jgi:heptosyltransferase III
MIDDAANKSNIVFPIFMHAFGNILIFHPSAIGDALLASPVAKTLKLNFPGATITYWNHESLRELLLGLCPSIDDYLDFSKETPLFALTKTVRQFKPDLFVDLSNSHRGILMSHLISGKTLRYIKRPVDERPIMHAVDNFMETILPVCDEIPKGFFPTIFPEALAAERLPKVLTTTKGELLPMIGIVPGVGKHRAHRAWLKDGWLYLLDAISKKGSQKAVLIGGEDEQELCALLERESHSTCQNLAGKLSLTETAALLKHCEVVISGDTGPAHLAVAVGTPVVGLYGPTYPERSGPYDYMNLVIDTSKKCGCIGAKSCSFTPYGDPGECMGKIMLAEILEKLDVVLYDRGKIKLESCSSERPEEGHPHRSA